MNPTHYSSPNSSAFHKVNLPPLSSFRHPLIRTPKCTRPLTPFLWAMKSDPDPLLFPSLRWRHVFLAKTSGSALCPLPLGAAPFRIRPLHAADEQHRRERCRACAEEQDHQHKGSAYPEGVE